MQIYTIQFDFNDNLNTEVPLNVLNGHNKSCFVDTIKILFKIYLTHMYTAL